MTIPIIPLASTSPWRVLPTLVVGGVPSLLDTPRMYRVPITSRTRFPKALSCLVAMFAPFLLRSARRSAVHPMKEG